MNFVRLPMLFVSGVFVPLGSASTAMRLASMLSPLTYANDLARISYGVGGVMCVAIDVVGLVGSWRRGGPGSGIHDTGT